MRSQMQGCVRRLLEHGMDDIEELLKPIFLQRSSSSASAREDGAASGAAAPLVKQPTQRRMSFRPGTDASAADASAADEAESRSWVLHGIETSLESKAKAPGKRSLKSSLRLARCVEVIKGLATDHVTRD